MPPNVGGEGGGDGEEGGGGGGGANDGSGGGSPGPPTEDDGDGDDDGDDGDGDGGEGDGRVPPRAAITVEAACADGLCRALTGVPVAFEDTSAGFVRFRRWEFGDGGVGAPRSERTVGHAWSAPGFYTVSLWTSNGSEESTASLKFLVEASEPAGSCEPDGETRCLLDSRFSVGLEWWMADGSGGVGKVVREGTNDSGLFYFFEPGENWEVLIKVLDGCALNDYVWVFGGSTTDLGYRIRVADTTTGEVKEYRNEPGRPAAAITDVTAFAGNCRTN